jgi:hypothetical protein
MATLTSQGWTRSEYDLGETNFGSCSYIGDHRIEAEVANSERCTKRPSTVSCRNTEVEKQLGFRAPRLIRVRNLRGLRSIGGGEMVGLELEDTTFDSDIFAGRVAICERMPGEGWYLTTFYHEWYITDNA